MSSARRRGPKPTLGKPVTIRFTPAMQAWLEAKQRPGGRGLSGVVRRLLEDAWRREQAYEARAGELAALDAGRRYPQDEGDHRA